MRKMHIIVLLMSIFSSFNLFAQKGEIYSTSDGAIKGYDPVGIFTQNKAVQGEKSITYEWKGATWHFASKESKEIFAANPEKYAPQYGGYCAYGMSKGYKAPTEIDTWTIVDSKLYFNYNQSVKTEWNKKQAEFIIKADQNWPTAKSK
jgi:YHS domain-containing protein